MREMPTLVCKTEYGYGGCNAPGVFVWNEVAPEEKLNEVPSNQSQR